MPAAAAATGAAALPATMDSRRLQELRDVYTQLSQQSTGPDGSQPAVGVGVGIDGCLPAARGGGGGAAVAATDLLHGRCDLGASPSPPRHAIADPVAAGAGGSSSTTSFVASEPGYNISSGTIAEPNANGQGQPSSLSVSATLAAASSCAPLNAPSNGHINSSSSLTPPSSNNSTAESYHRRQLLLAGAMTGTGVLGRSSSSSSTTTTTTQSGGAGANAGTGAAATSQTAILTAQQQRLKRESSSLSMSASEAEPHDGGGGSAGTAGSGGGKRKRKRSGRDSFYPGSYFEWTEELMVSSYTYTCWSL